MPKQRAPRSEPLATEFEQEVFAGRKRLGGIMRETRGYAAFDADGQRLGAFRTRGEAQGAILEAARATKGVGP
jgi:hypothetical protein